MAARKKLTIVPCSAGFLATAGDASKTLPSRFQAEAWGQVELAPDFRHCRIQFNGSEKQPFIVAFPTATNDGKAVSARRKFSKFQKALSFAQGRDLAAENHGRQFATELTRDEIAAVSGWRVEASKLTTAGVEVPALAEVIREALVRLSESPDGRKIGPELITAFIEHKKAKQIGKLQAIDYGSRLGRFREAFEGRAVASVATVEIDSWLSALKNRRKTKEGHVESADAVSPQTRKHYRAAVAAFFAWATPRRNPVLEIEAPQVEDPDRDHYTPEEAKTLLDWILANDPNLLPPVVLGLFCGVRTAERERLDLSIIDLAEPNREGEFILRRGKGRTGRARAVPLPPAAKAWLLAQGRREGPVMNTGLRVYHDRLSSAHEKAGVRKIENGFRHSFATYRGAILRSSDRLKDEMGNSSAIVDRHYRDARLRSEAEKFFAIWPKKTGKYASSENK